MNQEFLIALNAHPKIGSQTIKKVLAVFKGDAEKAWLSSEKDIRGIIHDDKLLRLLLEAKQNYDPTVEAEKLKKNGVGYTTIIDKNYPKLLKEVYDAPAVLYIKGNTELFNRACLAIVGSRKYSDYGRSVAKSFTRKAVEKGLAIVSGLALGVDSIVHKEVLDVGGKTIGVLGCGLDQIYPISNSLIGKEMINRDGLLVSEFPLGTPPYKQNFPLRNRIIAGLSLGTLVVEAREKSGALITAYQALEYNREVFAIPGDIDKETSRGSNMLIKQGAIPALCPDDIFEVLNIKQSQVKTTKSQKISLSKEEQAVFELIGKETSVEEIKRLSGYNIILINSTLTLLEMKGLIENIGGGRFRKVITL